MSNRIGTCPKCDVAGCLNYGVMDICGDVVYYPYTCEKCGFKGKEYYSLVFDTHTDKLGNEPQDKNFAKNA